MHTCGLCTLETATSSARDAFWHDLHDILRLIPACARILLGIDANDSVVPSVLPSVAIDPLHACEIPTASCNGDALSAICDAFDLVVLNTWQACAPQDWPYPFPWQGETYSHALSLL